MLLRSIIVDDEHIARQHLRRLLLAARGIEIVAECEDGPAALKTLERSRVDLLLLSIRMPGMNGFDVVERIESRPLPLIIFVTGYEQYAVRAFDTRAVGFSAQAGLSRTVVSCHQSRPKKLAADSGDARSDSSG